MKTTVAIIGLGNIGKAVGTDLSKSNSPFIAADNNSSKAQELAAQWGNFVQPETIAAALKKADLVVLAIPFGSISTFLREYAPDLEGKIIVDPSNPFKPNGSGGFKKIIGENETAGAINAAALPKNAKLVKALGTLSAVSLAKAAYQNPERAVLFYATDDTSIDPAIEQLIRNMGFDPLRIGGIDQSIRIEMFGDLHETGALGHTVTLAKAKQKI